MNFFWIEICFQTDFEAKLQKEFPEKITALREYSCFANVHFFNLNSIRMEKEMKKVLDWSLRSIQFFLEQKRKLSSEWHPTLVLKLSFNKIFNDKLNSKESTHYGTGFNLSIKWQ